jgi:flagellar biosynthesis protein FlhG
MRSTNAARRPKAGNARVFAVAGGKGGVGKSVVTSSLAIALARRGHRCVLIDADLGAANLHTMLGIGSPKQTLSHFLSREVPNLSDVMVETSEPNLCFVSGARALLDMANPSHAQKEKLLRHIQRLDVDYVFLDLSAGSSYNVLDLFLSAHHGLLVVVPEPTSIENAYHFLKAAYYRWLRTAARKSPVREALDRVLRQGPGRRLRSPLELITRVSQIDIAAGRILWERARAFAPFLLLNQAVTLEHRRIGPDVSSACLEYLGIRVRPLGSLDRDGCVRDAVNRGRPVLDLHPACSFAEGVTALADRIVQVKPLEAAPALRNGSHASNLSLHGLFETSVRLAPDTQPRRPALPPADLDHPGAYLKRCRESQALGLTDLCLRTRIRSLESIENECFDRLPPEPYVRAFVMQYAEALGIRETEALAASFVRRYRQARAA